MRSGHTPREVADRNRDRGGAIKSYNSQKVIAGSSDKQGLPAIRLLASVRLLAVFGLVALFTTIDTFALGHI